MATQLRKLLFSALDDVRIHPVRKWIRASARGQTVVDSRRALLVWEPRRVVGSYAVPVEDVAGELVPADTATGEERPVSLEEGPPVLDPSTPFSVHSTEGHPLTIRTADGDLPGAAFRADDPDLAGYVVLDWQAFTQWYEEDEPVVAHPHDPFDRIDCLRSSRHIEIWCDGVVLADSTRPTLLFETPLPTRFYLPARTSRWTCSNRPTHTRSARTRARPPTGQPGSVTRWCPTSPGPTLTHCTTLRR